MASRDLLVRILGDSRDVEAAFARSSRAANQMGRSVDTTGAKADRGLKNIKGFATGAAAGFAGAMVFNEVTTQLRAAIDVASNLREQMSKTRVVFEGAADEIVEWSKTTASSIGIARDEALAAASTFGAMFDQAGASSNDAARLSKNVVQLAADLASFNNTPVDESLNALRSGLSGEIEPLRRFQVFLTEASVAQQAMADTGKTNAKQLTQGEKILARYSLILQQTGKQQGDFARTSSGLANQQRLLAAQTRDLQANLGGLLLPAVTRLVTGLNNATAATLTLTKALGDLGNIKIPVIEIPLKRVWVDDPFIGDIGRSFGANLLPPQVTAAKPFLDALTDALTPDKIPDTDTAADAFIKDTGIGAILDKLPKKTQKVIRDGLKKFGDKGFKPVDNELGETLQRQFDDALDRLSLRFDQAEVTKGTSDELGVLREMERVINTRIKTQGRTTELLRLLFDVEQKRSAVLEEAGEKAAAAKSKSLARLKKLAADNAEFAKKATRVLKEDVQAKQFRALGLSGTGDELVPGIKNLQTRIAGALRRINSGQLDVPSKLVDRLKLARKLIRTQGGELTQDTRRVINDLISTVTQGQRKLDQTLGEGPLTKTTSLRANKILEGLGLGRDVEKELRARLSSFNSAGLALAGTRRPSGTFRGGVVVENHNTTYLDGDVVGRNVTRSQQKRKRRNPTQKRGPNGGV